MIGNSLKFTPDGYVEWGYTKEEGYLQFYVRDTGIGIETALHHRIFDRFSQDGQSLPNKGGGVGLGLAICKALVEMFGGKIWLSSEVNGGTTFYFTIPIEYKADKIGTENVGILPNWSGKLILIVDKHPASATELLHLIKPTLAVITIAKTLKEAIRNCFPANHYNTILFNVDDFDLDSPGFDEFLIRCAGKTPMIAYGRSLDEEAFAILQAKGFVFWLKSPVESELLVAAIRRFIN
ncbi:two-component system, chemotaxis family, CheB/CheR fusion protein [Williamwhitmania taraxaci]|uniref:histidine kinase n=1 Tax=Williamwhitmania taraxaci TaxID=1640674 RepID=A0A1G6RMD3_9BACT|nr:two-component system, chemotaxis family, CheB/CheR fusion protein [Williamwhitmania taraxaci]